ncbi:hypothetical protein [Moorena producens]|uniref:hypothetical protein n=1 Tax=Moorena producens TaxID=1155739 RepID=UPI000AF7F1DC|nr:hypothetical protein [Moorena producens]
MGCISSEAPSGENCSEGEEALYLYSYLYSSEGLRLHLGLIFTKVPIVIRYTGFFPYCLLPIAYCLLPIAYCLLPIACYSLLPAPCSLLPERLISNSADLPLIGRTFNNC